METTETLNDGSIESAIASMIQPEEPEQIEEEVSEEPEEETEEATLEQDEEGEEEVEDELPDEDDEESDEESTSITSPEIISVPRPDDLIQAGDLLMLVGSHDAIDKLPRE